MHIGSNLDKPIDGVLERGGHGIGESGGLFAAGFTGCRITFYEDRAHAEAAASFNIGQ